MFTKPSKNILSPRKLNVSDQPDFLYPSNNEISISRSPDGRSSNYSNKELSIRKSFSDNNLNSIAIPLDSNFAKYKSNTKQSLELIAYRKGLISMSTKFHENTTGLKVLRDCLKNQGNPFCGGGFVNFERYFRSLDHNRSRILSKDILKDLIRLVSNESIHTQLVNELGEIFGLNENNKDISFIDFEQFMAILKVLSFYYLIFFFNSNGNL